MLNALARSQVNHPVLNRLVSRFSRLPVSLVLWDGCELRNGFGPPLARLSFRDRRILWGFLVNPELYFGEGYFSGRIRVEGNLLSLLRAVYRSRPPSTHGNLAARLVSRWLSWRNSNSEAESRTNIHHHYDIGNEFYRLWLDRELQYTCAYFPDPGMSLEEAQLAKMDLVCRKLRLQPGEKVVEAGCGWGGLALHMARDYGVRVRAFNLSRNQVAYARERAEREGLSSSVEFVQDDYRNISGTYDAFVSVGMLEHVGPAHYEDLGRVVRRCLRTEGRGFLHFIGRNRPLPLNVWIRKRIFPGAHPPSLGEVMRIFEPHGFSVLDIENLRLHYARTLERWLARFEQSRETVFRMFGEEFVRAWRLYLAGSQVAFETGWLQLFQIVFNKAESNRVSMTREDLYLGESESQALRESYPVLTS